MDKDDFEKRVRSAVQEAINWQNEHLDHDRQTAYDYYFGRMAPGPAGRSQVTSWDVFETVESALPDLVEVFLAADHIAEYEPVGIEDEEFAQQATDYINYIVQKQNPGFMIFTTWIKDALMSKVGVVRAYWNEAETVKEREYRSITEDQMTMILDDDDVEVIEKKSYPDPEEVKARKQAEDHLEELDEQAQMQLIAALAEPVSRLYDLTVRITRKKGQLVIENVQPENFILTPGAKSLKSADIVGELKPITRSALRERGFDVDELTSFEWDLHEGFADAETGTTGWRNDDGNDEATEEIIVFEGFVRMDYDDDGIAEWRKVIIGGNEILENEAADEPDFVIMSPILIPHRAIGMSLADIVVPIQETSTAITRQYLDALVASNNPRTYAVTDQVNMDDLMNNRVGGIVRVKQQGAVGPLVTTLPATGALEGIEFMDSRREIRTGITRYNQGLDADSLNKTATGVTKIMSAGDRRKMLMARIMAETGVKELFRLLLKIVVENQDRKTVFRLRNEWVEVDPSPWPVDMDVTVDTGLGTGDKSELVSTLMMILQQQKEAMAAELPLVTTQELWNTVMAILKAAGIKGGERFFRNPSTIEQGPPQPPQPTPEQAIAEATVKAEEIKAQVAREKNQSDMQLKAADLQLKQLDLQIKQAEIKLKEYELQLKASVARHDAEIAEREQQRKEFETGARI